MKSDLTFSLPELRRIGWSRWNPIGLEGPPYTPADEYDSYLVSAAGMAAGGASASSIAEYLVGIETDAMGMPRGDLAKATAAAREIRDYVDRLIATPWTPGP